MLPTNVRRPARSENSPFDYFQDQVNRAISNWWGDGGGQNVTGVYPVDIREDGEHIYVEAELPGFKKDEIEVTLENGMLHIVAERKADTTRKGETHLSERRFTRVARSFTLPNSVDETKVDARLDGGVLNLTLHKREEVKPRKIEVK
jgi:HSP20 family molecular chaperone IbpA